MQLYPGWSARDNYGKKKKRKREKIQEPAAGGKRNAFSTSCKSEGSSYGPSVRDGGLLDSILSPTPKPQLLFSEELDFILLSCSGLSYLL
nr:transcription factor 7-like 2 [Oncorhynchus nerka]